MVKNIILFQVKILTICSSPTRNPNPGNKAFNTLQVHATNQFWSNILHEAWIQVCPKWGKYGGNSRLMLAHVSTNLSVCMFVGCLCVGLLLLLLLLLLFILLIFLWWEGWLHVGVILSVGAFKMPLSTSSHTLIG